MTRVCHSLTAFLMALTALSAAGCAATFVDPRVPAGEEKGEWLDFYLVGIIGREQVDVRDMCASGRAREVRLGENVLTLGVSVLTLGIYTPRKVTVTCAAKEPAKR